MPPTTLTKTQSVIDQALKELKTPGLWLGDSPCQLYGSAPNIVVALLKKVSEETVVAVEDCLSKTAEYRTAPAKQNMDIFKMHTFNSRSLYSNHQVEDDFFAYDGQPFWKDRSSRTLPWIFPNLAALKLEPKLYVPDAMLNLRLAELNRTYGNCEAGFLYDKKEFNDFSTARMVCAKIWDGFETGVNVVRNFFSIEAGYNPKAIDDFDNWIVWPLTKDERALFGDEP